MRVAAASVTWADAARQAAYERWIAAIGPRHGVSPASPVLASADASFRRYLRVQAGAKSLIVMDAPPRLEDVRPFVHIGGLIRAAGLHAPQVLEADEAQGFLLLEDLGQTPYLDALTREPPAEVERLMRDALAALVRLQQGVPAAALPRYEAAQIAAELALFPEWCVQREFGIQWGRAEQEAWQGLCRLIIDSALAQPVVAVHSDWMPRNLMVCPTDTGDTGNPAGNPGILDFQDAVAGPISYDLASLLRDAFHSWPEEQELDWAVRWWQQARDAGLPVAADFGEFWRALEWMGLQRHLRILGIFCRLKHRDGKGRYADDLPRFFGYATRVALRYAPLKPLLRLLEPMSGARLSSGFTF